MSAPGYLTNIETNRLKTEFPELVGSGRCPTCADKGTYTYLGYERECLCDEQKRLMVRYLHAGIGLTYQRLGWMDVALPGEQYDAVIDYLDNTEAYINRGVGLLLWGPLGTGKTLLMNLVLKELVKRKYNCYSTTFAGAVENFTATWGDKDEQKVFQHRFMRSHVLGLDDLGKEYKSSNRLSPTTFDYILRSRVQNARPTILTTNMTAQELQGGYGGGALSLLVEQSIEVPLTGADFRPTSRDRTQTEIKAGEVRPIT